MTVVINYNNRVAVRIRFVKSIEQTGSCDLVTETFGNGPTTHRNVESVTIESLEN